MKESVLMEVKGLGDKLKVLEGAISKVKEGACSLEAASELMGVIDFLKSLVRDINGDDECHALLAQLSILSSSVSSVSKFFVTERKLKRNPVVAKEDKDYFAGLVERTACEITEAREALSVFEKQLSAGTLAKTQPVAAES